MGFPNDWPDWLNPMEIHRFLLKSIGPEWTFIFLMTIAGIIVLGLVVNFVFVPLGWVRKSGGNK